ncbi:MAG: hypothetical protein IT562_10880 [Alphaproteobacteria bacterium]|nr:hypothetical protein [Alphaproteobacteria bacterium]
MVDLPSVSTEAPHIQAPHSRVTAADISSPYRDLAAAMATGAHEAGAVANLQAERAGFRAVSTDKEGNIQVESAPIVGEAADHYRKAVKMAALVQGEGVARRDMIAMRLKFEGDPEGYTKALEAYKAEKIKQYDQAAGPEVGLAIGRIIDRSGTQVYRGILNQKRRSDISGSKDALLGRAEAYGEDIATLSESGATNTPEFAQHVADYRAVLKEAADNPLIDFTPEQATAHFDRTMTRAKEAGFVGGVRQAYAAGGPEAAQEHIDEHLPAAFPALDRSRLAARAEQEIDALEAKADRLEIDRARAPLIARESREQEGFQRLASGDMTQGWLDRYGDEISVENRHRFTLAAEAPGGDRTDPAAGATLTMAALDDPKGALGLAADALVSGQVTRGDYAAANRFANQVAADATKRPWANDLRRNVAQVVMGERAAQRGGALSEVSEWLAANPDAPPAEARKYADEAVAQHVAQDRRTLRASLPPLRFAGVPADPATVAQAHSAAIGEAVAGRIGLSDLVAQTRLAAQWRDAVSKDA